MRKLFFLTFLFLLALTVVFGQVKQPILQQAQSVKEFFKRRPIEKAYLTFDKTQYNIGDTIYFKAFVTVGERNYLSNLSKVLYVDLFFPDLKVYRTLKLPIRNGLAQGDFLLSDSLVTGRYYVRAYTKTMLNYGESVFFKRAIAVASQDSKFEPILSPTSSVNFPDVQFFPEGGDLVAGVNALIAFKAVSPEGVGVPITGKILNVANQTVAKFSTSHRGMGSFYFLPLENELYHAEITFANQHTFNCDFPKVKTSGIALGIKDSLTKLSVHLLANNVFFENNKDKVIGLMIYSGGKLTTVNDIMDGPDKRFDIEKKGLSPGIAQITLISATGEPLCERLVFIDKGNQLRLELSTNKQIYHTGNKTTVTLKATNSDGTPAVGHFSVSVVNKNSGPLDLYPSIYSYLQLNSNLKGTIEDPNYYFANTDQQKTHELDLVMLTNSFRRFNWSAITNDDLKAPTFEPETGLSINGIASLLNGKSINRGQISLIRTADGQLLSEETDRDGRFSFRNLTFFDSTKFIISALDAKGNKDTKIAINQDDDWTVKYPLKIDRMDAIDFAINKNNPLDSNQRTWDNHMYKNKGIMLQQVNIRATKKAEYTTQSLAGAGHADQVLKMKDIAKGGLLTSALDGRLNGVVFNDPSKAGGGAPHLKTSESIEFSGDVRPMLVIVDGTQRPLGTGINDIGVNDVETIEVLKYSGTSIYGLAGAGGVLIITTKQGSGKSLSDIVSRGMLPVVLSGFYKAKEFNLSQFDGKIILKSSNLNATIMWLPELTTNNSGIATFEYYNTSAEADVEIVAEGITENGFAGKVKTQFKIVK
ncbi:hypothetical protein [Mucilaginibacter sp.]|uniref:hypothetical protein n=1 Tax=Mucilaginibacter sp. TaxID=1882438 RepID=UPI0035BC5AED